VSALCLQNDCRTAGAKALPVRMAECAALQRLGALIWRALAEIA
jgi:hypothetical protein